MSGAALLAIALSSAVITSVEKKNIMTVSDGLKRVTNRKESDENCKVRRFNNNNKVNGSVRLHISIHRCLTSNYRIHRGSHLHYHTKRSLDSQMWKSHYIPLLPSLLPISQDAKAIGACIYQEACLWLSLSQSESGSAMLLVGQEWGGVGRRLGRGTSCTFCAGLMG
jgi:hypothetical protein